MGWFSLAKKNFKAKFSKMEVWDRFGTIAAIWFVFWSAFSIFVWTPLATLVFAPMLFEAFSFRVAGFLNIWLFMWPMLVAVAGLVCGLFYMTLLRSENKEC